MMTAPTLTNDLFEYGRRLGMDDMTRRDMSELQAACHRVYGLMRDRAWHRAQRVIDVSGQREGLRRMRELEGIGYRIDKRRVVADQREYEYRLLAPGDEGYGEVTE
jgi:hypothetical protein